MSAPPSIRMRDMQYSTLFDLIDQDESDAMRPERRLVARDTARQASPVPDGRRVLRGNAHVLFWLNLVVVLLSFYAHDGFANMKGAVAVELVAGRVTGLVATYLMLVQLLLTSRIPMLDSLFGLDRLVRMHARLGRYSFSLLLLHVVLTTVAYAGSKAGELLHAINVLVLHTQHMLFATIAFGFICAVVFASIRKVRRKMQYQTWHFLHLYAYLGVVLAVPHEIFMGKDFVGHPLTQIYWGVLYAVCAGAAITYRVGVPLYRSLRLRLRVVQVVRESADTVSIYMKAPGDYSLNVQAGQFLYWRFLDRHRWAESHPYSISALPDSGTYRITVKALGDSSSALGELQPGTRVMIEGPYGVFTPEVRTQRKVVLIAAGVGITPVRALIEGMPARRGDISVLYRVRDHHDVIFRDELVSLSEERGVDLQWITGARTDYPSHAQPFSVDHLLDAVDGIRDADVYICGPESLSRQTRKNLREIGVPGSRIHYESFEF